MAAPSENMCEFCEIEATVVTGFEQLAKEEILEKLNVTASTARGKVNFNIPVGDTRKVLQLSSIDNAYVVIKKYENFEFADDVDSILKQFRSIVPEVDWELGLKVWNEVFSFEHPISPTPTKNIQNESTANDNKSDVKEQTPEDKSKVEEPHTSQAGDNEQTRPASGDSDNKQDLSSASQPSSNNTDVEPATKRVRQTAWDPLMPAFRVTCYRSGTHIFQSPQAAANFGGEIHNYFCWNVDMKNYNIEVILTIEKSFVYVSLGLTKESLHKRNITKFGPTTLRPTIAYNILRFCHIKDTEVVCDPMCGGGSLPLEAALNWPNAVHVCGDIFDEAPRRTRSNIDAVNDKRNTKGKKSISTCVFHWDATRLPLRDESVDVFVTDMPFGKRSGSKMSNWHLYPRVLKELARVCRRDTGRACLLTQDKKCLLKSLGPLEGLWRRGPIIGINIGGLAAGVFLLFRTGRRFLDDAEFEKYQKQKEERQQQDQGKSKMDTT